MENCAERKKKKLYKGINEYQIIDVYHNLVCQEI